MIPSYELAATPGCRVAMSGQFAHNPGHCGVKQTRPSGLQRLFLHTHTHTHTLTHAHTSKGLTSPAKHSTPTSEYFERGATQPPRVLGSLYGHHRDPLRHPDHVWSPPCRPAVKCPSANQRGGGGAVRGELAGSGISLDVMMMINQEPYNMTADSALLVAFWMNRNASVDRYAIMNAVFLSICIGVATWGQRRAASMLHDVDFKTVNKLLTRDALLNVQNAHIWQQSKSISGLNF